MENGCGVGADQIPGWGSNLEELIDKVLVCRQCGTEFIFAASEQEYYAQKGWLRPRHCPRCRSDRRNLDRHHICSVCGSTLKKEDAVCCSTCVDKLKQENLGKQEDSPTFVTAELENWQQTGKELREIIEAFKRENSKLVADAASWQSLNASVQQLREHYEAFQQSYVCDIDKLTGLLLEVQGTLARRRGVNMWHRIRLALIRKSDEPNRTTDELGASHV